MIEAALLKVDYIFNTFLSLTSNHLCFFAFSSFFKLQAFSSLDFTAADVTIKSVSVCFRFLSDISLGHTVEYWRVFVAGSLVRSPVVTVGLSGWSFHVLHVCMDFF